MSVDVRDSDFSMRPDARDLSQALFFAALSLGIRWSVFRDQVIVADDVVHLPSHHLLSHRPTQALELAFWQGVAGPDYLLGRLPVLVGHFYLIVLLLGVNQVLKVGGVGGRGRLVAMLLVVTSPVMNPHLIWNVFVGVTLALASVTWSFSVAGRTGWAHRLGAAVLLLMGIGSYQFTLGLYLSLITLTTIHMSRKEKSSVKGFLLGQTVVVVLAAILYLLYLQTAQMFGIEAWGNRGLVTLSDIVETSFWQEKVHGVTNMVANLYQPVIGAVFGVKWAQSLGFYAHFVWGAVVGAYSLLVGGSIKDAVVGFFSFVIVTFVCCSVILILSVTPSGLRIDGALLVTAVVVSVWVVSDSARRGRAIRFGNRVVGVFLLGFVVCNIGASRREAALRMEGMAIDRWILERIEHVQSRAKERPKTATLRILRPAELQSSLSEEAVREGGREVTVNYNVVGSYSYSNVLQGFSTEYLERFGPGGGVRWTVQTAEGGDECVFEEAEQVLEGGMWTVGFLAEGDGLFTLCLERAGRGQGDAGETRQHASKGGRL